MFRLEGIIVISPIFGFILSLLVRLLVPYLSGFISFELGLLFFLACTRLGVYTVIIAG
jgi:NADH:ubiquinone oxidoreductase subunit H